MLQLQGYFLSIVCLVLASQASFAQPSPEPLCNIYYVDQNATGPVHDGSSWCSALLNLSDALLMASDGDIVRVANGVYKPSTIGLSDPRTATFNLPEGIALKGGYQGCDAYRPEVRDVNLFETILSGDLNGDDDSTGNKSDNTYHVVTAYLVRESTTIDGFSIAHGYANAVGTFDIHGGGIFAQFSALTISHCNIYDNYAMVRGGGLYLSSSNINVLNTQINENASDGEGGGIECSICSLFIQDSEVSYNVTDISGGAINVFVGSLSLERVMVRGNEASDLAGGSGGVGGGLSLYSSPLTIRDSLLLSNGAAYGGAVYIHSSNANIVGCTITRNIASQSRNGGGILVGSTSTLNITNTIAWGNTAKGFSYQTAQVDAYPRENSTFSHCNIQSWNGYYGGVGNFQAEPRFVDEVGDDGVLGTIDDDLRLTDDSPCVNRGDPSLVSENDDTDLDNNPRAQGCRTDIGAYETTRIPAHGDFDNDEIITIADFAYLQQCFGLTAATSIDDSVCLCMFDGNADGIIDMNDISEFANDLIGSLK